MIPRRAARRTARRTARRVGRRQDLFASNAETPQEESGVDDLERLFRLKEEGAISEAEYEQKKRDLL